MSNKYPKYTNRDSSAAHELRLQVLRYKQANRKEKRSLDVEFQRLSKDHGKASSRHLCLGILTNLPRELRDRFYRHLLSFATPNTNLVPADVIRHEAEKDAFVCDCSMAKPSIYPNDPDEVLPFRITYMMPIGWPFIHYLNGVPMEALIEMAEVWYRTNTFVINDLCNLGLFLKSDNWKIGVAAQERVRALKLSIDMHHLEEVTDLFYHRSVTCQQGRVRNGPFTTLDLYMGGQLNLKEQASVFVDFSLDSDVLYAIEADNLSANTSNALQSAFTTFKEVQQDSIRLMIYPHPSKTVETWKEKKMIRMLDRLTLSAEEWLKCVRDGPRAGKGEEEIEITKSEQAWYNVLHA